MEANQIVQDYNSKREIYDNFAATVSNLLARLISAEGIAVHSIAHRCKTASSLKEKVERKRSYSSLSDITDLAGVRLITHYEDDVDKIAKIIESEFLIDDENTIDKRKSLEPEKFGYLSLHYVLKLRPDRLALKEYSVFESMKAEIQVRSILQHTWAEIEHDTGYKSEIEVPRHIRRRFSRLAGLLEIADQEFIGIRNDLNEYSSSVALLVESAQENNVGDDPDEKLMLDKISLEKFVELDVQLRKLELRAASDLGATIDGEMIFDSKDIARFNKLGVRSLAELKRSLLGEVELINFRVVQIKKNFERLRFEASLQHGFLLYVLMHVLIMRNFLEEPIESVMEEFDFNMTPEFLEHLEELRAEIIKQRPYAS